MIADSTDTAPNISCMLRMDADPGEEPRPSGEPSEGMETEDELAEDLIASPRQSFGAAGQPAGHGPEEDEEGDGGGMEIEEETRSPRGGRDQVLEFSKR